MDKFAVIDIGSNSVRLVVYESRRRVPYVIFNEKVLCGLGRGVSETGLMMDDSMEAALHTLKRFALLIDKMEISDLRAIATSAVRDAKNGPDFIETVRETTGIDVEVIDGEEEGRLAGLGVVCAFPRAHGIAGDLGGGSLELIHVNNLDVCEKVTLPIGPLQFQNREGEVFHTPKKEIDRVLSEVDWLDEYTGQSFYAVGGSWRAFAKINMLETGYPLNNIHNYRIEVDDALALAKKLSKMTPEELQVYAGHISTRRLRVLSLSALILWRVLKKLKPVEIVVSGYGIREGLLFDGMPSSVQNEDPLIQGCHEVAEMTGRFPEHGLRLLNWIEPLFENESPEDRRLRLAICMLSDVGWRGHPEYRAEKVISEIMYGRLIGIDHRGIGLIGLALYVCYGGSIGDNNTNICLSLVSEEDVQYARRVGLGLRLAQRLSAGTARGLNAASLEIDGSQLLLNLQPGKEDLINEVVRRRFDKLASEFGLEAVVRPDAVSLPEETE
ncbi:Ppx/GppA family phosphatase [Emcibacter nanhaiensis]|uniref:Ppx/GppA family phosphatase n=1 Tax=Emcibacter nanhaiensis TaxID=1505037 RepID=A0A501PSH3_9PROT|nr:Ppx/GppA family phosphatase [Emcibacter nanhaiensis]TPD63088.1 Ppx/GppA family phosphatase [Emcibacter nanhaiensis]